tara:strand:- start:135 stop:389 length:255 start_codon:yes stop_codon:yes gene_type:complete
VSYKGFRNRETHSAWKHLRNEPTFHSTIYNFGPEAVRDFCYRYWPTGETPDGSRLSKVDWQQLEAYFDYEIMGVENLKKYELFS